MTTVKTLHDRAMRLADRAILSRYAQDAGAARVYSRIAYLYERKAAERVPLPKGALTATILWRSAGWLAFNAELYEEAWECAQHGLRVARLSSIEGREFDELRQLAQALPVGAIESAYKILTRSARI